MTKFCKKLWLILLIAVLSIDKKDGVRIRNKHSCDDSIPEPFLVKDLSAGSLNFSLDLYKMFSAEANIFLSPLSISMALAMISTGSAGLTLDEIRYVLHLEQLHEEDVPEAFASVLDTICSNPNYTLSTANRIYIQSDFPVKKSFIDNLKSYFKSSAESVNFITDANAVVSEINSWVEEQTDKNIKDLFEEGGLSSDTVMVLINAIYFKGSWNQKFNKTDTHHEHFHMANGKTVSVPMMNMKEKTFRYATSSKLKSKMLQMEYAGNRLMMFLILPDETKGLKQMTESLTADSFRSVKNDLQFKQLTVKIPKFQLNYKTDLNDVLADMGLNDLFDAGKADLSGMVNLKEKDTNLYVSKAVHQAFVAVDEEGTKAAAATGSAIILYSAHPERHEFIADHPFAFIIYDTLTELILFIGNVDTLPDSK